MSRSTKRRTLASFTVPTKVQVLEPDFEPLSSLASLDFESLGKGTHKIEIGFLKGGCGRNLVTAIVKNGMVTGCEVAPCKDQRTLPRAYLAALRNAKKKISAGKKWHPMPLSEMVRSKAKMLGLVIVGAGCIYVCIPITDKFQFCFLCCAWPPNCWDTSPYPTPVDRLPG